MQSTQASSATTSDERPTAGRAPLPTEHAVPGRFLHTSAGGFCCVCGTVWPCARANAEVAVPAMRAGR